MNRTAPSPIVAFAPAPPRRPGMRAYLAAFADGMASLLDFTGAGLHGRRGRFLGPNAFAADQRALRGDFQRVVGSYGTLLHETRPPDGEHKAKAT